MEHARAINIAKFGLLLDGREKKLGVLRPSLLESGERAEVFP